MALIWRDSFAVVVVVGGLGATALLVATTSRCWAAPTALCLVLRRGSVRVGRGLGCDLAYGLLIFRRIVYKL